VIDNIWTTKGQAKSEGCVGHGAYKSYGIRSYNQKHTDSWGHYECIQQGLTDGCEPVICHGSQKETLSCHKETNKPHLCSTAYKGDAFFLCKNITQHLRSNGGRGTNIYKGQMAKKKVHGSVEPGVSPYESDHPQVTPQGDKINKEKHNEKDNLLVEIICEA
jgi:hypothetical protein